MDITATEFSKAFPTIARSTKGAHLSALLDVIEVRQLSKGQGLIEENKPSDTFFLVLDGSLSVTINTDGQTLSLGKIDKGGCVGEMTFLDTEPALATVTAASDSTVLALSEENFQKLDKQDPAASTSLMRALSHIMSDRIRAATDTILPLMDAPSEHTERDVLSGMLGNAYANLFGLEGRS